MTRQKFIEALRDVRLSRRIETLKSSYIPQTSEEMESVAQAVLLANPELQRAALEVTDRTPYKVSFSLIRSLAHLGFENSIRLAAVQRLAEHKDPDTTDALLACVHDSHPDVQERAIRALEGRKRPQIVPLLLDRLDDPEADVGPEFPGNPDRIRRAAIIGLGTDGCIEAIAPLVRLALTDHPLRAEITITLKAISRVRVDEVLLDAVEGALDDELPAADLEFRLFAVRTIASKPPQASKTLARYKDLLADVYVHEIARADRPVVMEEIARLFDERFCRLVSEQLQARAGNPGVTARIIKGLRLVPLERSFEAWLAALDRSEKHIRTQTIDALTELAGADVHTFANLLRHALAEDGQRHQPNRLPIIVERLAPEHGIVTSQAILPFLDDHAARDRAQCYLVVIWNAVNDQQLPELINVLTFQGYLAISEIRPEITAFFTQRWDEANEPRRQLLLDTLLQQRTQIRGKARASAVDQLIANLSSTVGQPQLITRQLVTYAVKLDSKDRLWNTLSAALQAAPSDVQHETVADHLQQVWHHDLMRLLVNQSASQIPALCRHMLSADDYCLSDADRPWVITLLGQTGSVEDVGLLVKEVVEGPPLSQVAAAQALGELGVPLAEEPLRSALRRSSHDLVLAALEGLAQVAAPEVETVHHLRERASNAEPEPAIREAAGLTMKQLMDKHLNNPPPSKGGDKQVFLKWVDVLKAFGRCDCAALLKDLLWEAENPDDPESQVAVAEAIGVCCTADEGLSIIEERLKVEREPSVIEALKGSADVLQGSPDRSVFDLLGQVCESSFDQQALLGSWCLTDLFALDITLPGLRQGLVDAIEVHQNPDRLIETLDSIADLLMDEVILAAGEDVNQIKQYGNQIGKVKSINIDIHRAAQGLHTLRDKAKGPHLKDSAGRLREGLTREERADGIGFFKAFVSAALRYLCEQKRTRQEAAEEKTAV